MFELGPEYLLILVFLILGAEVAFLDITVIFLAEQNALKIFQTNHQHYEHDNADSGGGQVSDDAARHGAHGLKNQVGWIHLNWMKIR